MRRFKEKPHYLRTALGELDELRIEADEQEMSTADKR